MNLRKKIFLLLSIACGFYFQATNAMKPESPNLSQAQEKELVTYFLSDQSSIKNIDQLVKDVNKKLTIKIQNKDVKIDQNYIFKKTGTEKTPGWDGCSPIHIAACAKSDDLVKALIKIGADINQARLESGATPLHFACKTSIKNIMALIDCGKIKNINALDSKGRTPIHYLANPVGQKMDEKDTISAIDSLVKNKANINAIDKDGKKPIDLAKPGSTVYKYFENINKVTQKTTTKPGTQIPTKPAPTNSTTTTTNKPAPKKPEPKIPTPAKKQDDIVNVCVFLEQCNKDGKSYELDRFREALKPNTTMLTAGAVTSALIEALEQKVDIIIASAPLANIIEIYKKNRTEYYKKNIELLEKSIEESIEEFEKIEKDIKEPNKNDQEVFNSLINVFNNTIENYKKRIKISKNILDDFSIYKTEDSEFAIFVKKGKNLKDISLNQSLKTVDKNKLEQEFSAINSEFVNLESLKTIFSNNDIKRKIIYLSGHGGFGSLIAQLTRDQYIDFTNYLSTISCIFLFTSSCYSGGLTTIDISKKFAAEQKEEYMNLSFNFIMVMSAISDVPSHMFVSMNYNKFFDCVHDLFERQEKNLFTGQKINNVWTDKKPFKNILINLTGSDLENTPLIRFPGVRQFFRAVDVDDKVQIITYPFLLEHELEQFQQTKKSKQAIKELEDIDNEIIKARLKDNYTKLKQLKEIRKNKIGKIKIVKKPIEIKDKEAILLYPSVLNHTIKIVGQKVPALVSMFPGNAKHFIENLDASQIQLDKLISDMLGQLGIESGKSFLIGNITCKNFKNSRLMHPNNPNLDDSNQNINLKKCIIERKINSLSSTFLLNQDYKMLIFMHQTITASMFESYWHGKFKDLINIKPSQEAYMEATGGIESEITFKNAIDRFLKEQDLQKKK